MPSSRSANAAVAAFRRLLLAWYADNGRHGLPWRQGASPWHVLASEIMLQQTQVDRVAPKYLEFVRRWPTPRALAKTSPAEFLKFWSGLGYNRRAMNLHRLASALAEMHGGNVPRDQEALLALPGIGRYTAGAVAAFAFNDDATPWDTNIRRIFLRIFHGGEFASQAPSDASLESALAAALPKGRSRAWHEALMDFGSAVCTSRRPSCADCPLQKLCQAAPHFLAGAAPASALIRPQAKFEGSFRQVRGAVLRALSAAPGTLTVASLARRLALPRVPEAVEALAKEGLVSKRGARVSLPS